MVSTLATPRPVPVPLLPPCRQLVITANIPPHHPAIREHHRETPFFLAGSAPSACLCCAPCPTAGAPMRPSLHIPLSASLAPGAGAPCNPNLHIGNDRNATEAPGAEGKTGPRERVVAGYRAAAPMWRHAGATGLRLRACQSPSGTQVISLAHRPTHQHPRSAMSLPVGAANHALGFLIGAAAGTVVYFWQHQETAYISDSFSIRWKSTQVDQVRT